jgi:hypothetical protein
VIDAVINEPFTAILSDYDPAIASELTAGTYMLRWGRPTAPDPDDQVVAEEDLRVHSSALLVPVDGLAPSVDEIGALLHARTNVGGVEVGTFTDSTRPTDAQVQALIDMAVSDLQTRVGTVLPEDLVVEGRRLASLQAAALVEASFFPGELDTDRSAYRQYTAMYLSGIEALTGDARRPSALRLV